MNSVMRTEPKSSWPAFMFPSMLAVMAFRPAVCRGGFLAASESDLVFFAR